MNKKAMSTTMKDYLLAVFTLIIVLFLLAQVLNPMGEASETKKCERYIDFASKLKNHYTKETRVNLNRVCDTREVVIEAKGRKDEDIKKNAVDAILKEAYFCAKKWGYSFGEVVKNPFNQWKVDNVCVVCTAGEFGMGFSKVKSIDGLLARTTDINVPGSSKKLYEFFTGSPPTEHIKKELEGLKVNGKDGLKDSINTNENFFVVYSMDMETTTESFFKRVGIFGAIGGATPIIPAIALKPLLWLVRVKVGTVVLAGIAIGAIGGAYSGANVREAASARVMILPVKKPDTNNPQQTTDEFSRKLKDACKSLGQNPLEDPWADEAII